MPEPTAVPSTLIWHYRKVGPYRDDLAGGWAFRYECVDCDWALTVVADLDPLPENVDRLARHSDSHVIAELCAVDHELTPDLIARARGLLAANALPTADECPCFHGGGPVDGFMSTGEKPCPLGAPCADQWMRLRLVAEPELHGAAPALLAELCDRLEDAEKRAAFALLAADSADKTTGQRVRELDALRKVVRSHVGDAAFDVWTTEAQRAAYDTERGRDG